MPASIPHRSHRFANVLTPTGAPRPLYDDPLFETDEWLVVPTLGAIIPNWLLVLPRHHFMNLRSWRESSGIEPLNLLDDLCALLHMNPCETLWFEHGPVLSNTSLGCGIDHAHLHVLVKPPFSFATFHRHLTDHSPASWVTLQAREAYASIPANKSYLLAGQGDVAILCNNVDFLPSQYFRRAIASIVDRPHTWDYTTHPYMENIRQTIYTFAPLLTPKKYITI